MAETYAPGGLDDVEVLSCDFAFRALDDDGAPARYEALFAFRAPADGRLYLVYADEQPDDAGEVGTYASVAADPAQVASAQAAVDGGCAPRKPPLLELADLVDEAQWDLVETVLAMVEAEEDE